MKLRGVWKRKKCCCHVSRWFRHKKKASIQYDTTHNAFNPFFFFPTSSPQANIQFRLITQSFLRFGRIEKNSIPSWMWSDHIGLNSSVNGSFDEDCGHVAHSRGFPSQLLLCTTSWINKISLNDIDWSFVKVAHIKWLHYRDRNRFSTARFECCLLAPKLQILTTIWTGWSGFQIVEQIFDWGQAMEVNDNFGGKLCWPEGLGSRLSNQDCSATLRLNMDIF